MLSRERVLCTIEHREPDRVPLYCWLFGLGQVPEIEARFGSVREFYDVLHLDMVQSFPAKGPLDRSKLERPVTSRMALDIPFLDPDDAEIYTPIRSDVEYHKDSRGRAVFAQTPGVFEAATGILGFENTLLGMADEPASMRALFGKIARWSARYVDNCLALGVDVIHVSDDWGANGSLLFDPRMWWEMVFPTESVITRHAARRGAILSLHSDGCIWDALDGVVELGFRVVHPVQQSAGMDPGDFKRRYGDRLCMYGGLDVRTTLGHGDFARVEAEIRRNMRILKPGGGFIFCTSHTPMAHCTVDEILFAYELAFELAGYPC
jgi:uroporphyrinogen decarboxylase